MKTFFTIITLFPSLFLLGQMHQNVFPDLSGEELLTTVRQNYTPAFTTNSSLSKDIMYGEVYNVNDSVSCVYTGFRVYLPPNEDPSQAAFAGGINREHTMPNSFLDGSIAENDLHNLYPSKIEVNADRSAYPFAEIPDNQTSKWYFMNIETTNIPNQNIEKYSELIQYDFEPREDHKGNVARAMMYMYAIYKNMIDLHDNTYFDLQRITLCSWHALDPVDEAEWDRTWIIASYQDDKPNPFVLDCSLAYRAFCPEFEACIPPNTTENLSALYFDFPQNSPNPFTGQTQLHYTLLEAGNVQINIFDTTGKIVKKYEQGRQASGNYQLDIQGLKGLYTVQLQVEINGKIIQKTQRIVGY